MKVVYFKISDIYKKIAKYVYSILIVVAPILRIYASPVPMVTLPEFLFMLFILFTVVFDFKKYKLSVALIPFSISIVINLFVVLFTKTGDVLFDDIGTGLRLLFYFTVIILFLRDYFDYKIALKSLVCVSVILCLYALLQLGLAFKGIYLYNYIPLLKQYEYDASRYLTTIELYKKYGGFYRMLALFREPAHFSEYLSITFILLLIKKEKTIWSIILGLFFLVVSAATLSSTGIIMAALTLVVFIVFLFIDHKLKWWVIIIIGVVLAGLITGFVLLGGWDFFVKKTFHDGEVIEIFNDSRMTVVPLIFKTDFIHAVFGRGMGSTAFYMSSYVRAVYCLGIVGLVSLAITLAIIYNKAQNRSAIALLFLFIVISAGTATVFGIMALPYFAFMVYGKEEKGTLFKKFAF